MTERFGAAWNDPDGSSSSRSPSRYIRRVTSENIGMMVRPEIK